MKRLSSLLIAVVMVPGFSASAYAALTDNDDGTVTQVRIDGSTLMWLKDANFAETDGYVTQNQGRMTWGEANAWITHLNTTDYDGDGVPGFANYSDWRLPKALPVSGASHNLANSNDGSTDVGYNITSPNAELAYMFYVELENRGLYDTAGNILWPGTGSTNPGPFENLQAWTYRYGTEIPPNNSFAMDFSNSSSCQTCAWGWQFSGPKAASYYAWAVRSAGADIPSMSYLPQVVAGGSYATIFTYTNTGADTANGNLILSDQKGDPFPVSLAEASTDSQSAELGEQRAAVGSTFPISIAPGATVFMTATAPNPSDPAKSGWARVEYAGGSLGGVGTFQLAQDDDLQTVAGVLASQPVQAATIPVDNDDTQERYTGFAVANHGNQNINITLVTLNESGSNQESISPPELNPLGPHRQIATFLHQYDLAKYGKFKGSVVLTAGGDDGFVLTALVQNQGQLTAIPVISGSVVAAAEMPLPDGISCESVQQNHPPRNLAEAATFFPQLVVGGDYSTFFTCVNTGDSNVDGNLIITDQQGAAFSVLLDGTTLVAEPSGFERVDAVQGSNFSVQIAPGAAMFLTATALNPSDLAASAWARIEYTGGVLGGVSTFQLMQGGALQTIAGVLASNPLVAATIPVDNNDPLARYTGFAVANPDGEAINIRIAILDEAGNIQATIQPPELNPLGGYSQVATFLHQYDAAKYKTFRGSIVMMADGGKTFIVTALVLNQGLYTAIPVIPGMAPFIQ